jgi:hypothetical protein
LVRKTSILIAHRYSNSITVQETVTITIILDRGQEHENETKLYYIIEVQEQYRERKK